MAYSFKFANYFPTLSQTDFDLAYEEIQIIYYGIPSLWSILGAQIRQDKIDLCYQYLTAWYLADMNPTCVVGIQATGGMPLTSKSIGGVSLSFNVQNVQEEMKPLLSNVFGVRALDMILSAPERAGIYG